MVLRVKIETNDGEIFELPAEVVQHLKTCYQMIETLGSDCIVALPLSNVRSDIFRNILIWIEKYFSDRKESDDLLSWESDMFNSWNREYLFEFMNAASFLEIDPLIKSTSTFVALQLTKYGNKHNEMREYLSVENEMNESDIQEFDKISGLSDERG
uniref:Skp1_POZ domain-containing protein n=1 Tax=Parastrongyloides trichosuri TaxID=131310 RepID=A0A0N4ZYM9_PARTI